MAINGRSSPAGQPPARPSIELLGSSASTGSGMLGEDNFSLSDDETVDSVMAKLAIERRVQYGAEKMLDVIEQRSGAETGDSAQVKERITAQLEAANEHIRLLEAKLERLRGGSHNSTPNRSRRRVPKLNGYPSSTSLNPSVSSSLVSTTLASARKPLPSRHGSTLTPERTGSSGQGGRRRSLSTGAESFDFGRSSDGSQRLVWAPGESFNSQGELSSEDENSQVLLETVRSLTSRLKDLVQQEHASKGKEPEKKGDAIRDCLTRMSDVLKKSRATRQAVKVDELMPYLLPALADSASTRRRSSAYRLLRHLVDRPNWGTMLAAGLEWPIVRTFTRDSKFIKEKEQALRLLRAVVTLPPPNQARTSSRSVSRKGHLRTPSGLPNDDIKLLLERRVPISDGLIRAIVSAAENPDDPIRNACVLTLIEIGVFDVAALVNSDAFRTLLLAFKDGPLELGPGITGLLLHLANQPSTRQYLLPGADVESVLVGLTEEYGKPPSRQLNKQVERVQHSVTNVTLLLSSWTGYFVLCMGNFRAFRSLISTLHVPIPEVKDAFLNLLYTCLRIKSPTWKEAFLEGKRLTVYNRTQEAASQLHDDLEEEEPPHVLNLVDHYVALLLATFIEAGLLESLVALIEEDMGTLNRKATLLLGEVLQMGNRILPLQFAAKLQALPRLFAVAADFASPAERHLALSALSSIDSLNRNQSKATKAHGRHYHGSSNIQDSLQRGQRQVQQVKLRMGLQIDDKQFIQMINDSGILLGRDHTKWNYDIIMDLIEGPLLNPKRLDEAIKATKFLRRLFQFFHPYNNRFSAVKRTRPNHKWVRLGCSLLETMLANPEGIRFLGEDKLLRQLAECFAELDPYVGMPSPQPVFARDRLVNSLTYGYFEMIGTLSKQSEGMKLLEKFRFFTCFYHLSEQRSRDDITRIIIECFDYSIDAHPRIVLSKALTSSYMETRLFATHHLGRLIHESPSLVDWGLQLMITQLYDTSMEVCEVAVMYLEDMCTEAASLEKVVQLRPTLEHLGDIGHPLFMRFVSTSVGFRYLHQTGYIERELEHWLTERNLLYVIETETWVSKTLRPFSTDTVEDYWEYDGTAPTHFFGELTKTPEGCQWLKNKGLVGDFCEIVRLHGMEPEDAVVMTNVKSVLWILGNIGSTDGGLPFLEDEEIIDAIIEIAEQSPVLTMRGVAFFVIGLISSTRVGAEMLEEYGWIATRTSLGMTTGLCLPNDLSRFVRIEPWHRPSPPPTTPLPPLPSAAENEIINYIRNLSNYVLAAGAMNNLKRLRSRHPMLFASLTLFHRAWSLISNNHYHAPVRRFILELFDVSIEPDTLAALRRLDAGPYNANGNGDRVQSHSRKRSTSSPGPMPMFGTSPAGPNGPNSSLLNMRRRSRGLTTSDLPKVGFTPAVEPAAQTEDDGRADNGGPKRVEGFATPPRMPMAVV